MAIQPHTKLTTAQEFEAFIARPENRHRRFQLIHGEIVEKLPTQLHGYVASQFDRAIGNYLEDNPIGYVYVEARYRPVGDENNDRVPDVSFSTNPAIVERGPAAGMPDLAIEVQSPDDDVRDMLQLAFFYLDNGAKLVWLALFKTRRVVAVTKEDIITLDESDILEGGDILPGFKLPVSKIFPPR